MGVYAANRLASIAEEAEFSQEINEAFADESRETSNITCYGIVAQLHENDARMFDAIIGADFASVANSKLLEASEQAESEKKMSKVTSSAIWQKIEKAIIAIKEAILKVARKFREKVMDLLKVDKKIIDKYGNAIAKADSIDVAVKFAVPTKSITELAKESIQAYNKLRTQAEKVKDILGSVTADADDSEGGRASGARAAIDAINNDLIKSVDAVTNKAEETKITKAMAEEAVKELRTGKAVINATKKNADNALAVIKSVEHAAKAAKSKKADNPAVGAQVYKAVSGIGAGTSKAMNTVNNGLIKILGANRKIVLAAGRAALGAKVQNEATLSAIFDSSDLYVAEMCEMI